MDDSAQGLNNGSSWQHAYTSFQSAFSVPGIGTSITELWVAEGTYVPTVETIPGNPLSATFMLPVLDIEEGENLSIYGGFPNGGGDGTFGARNPDLYKSRLSGDRLCNDCDYGLCSECDYAGFFLVPPVYGTLMDDNVLHVVSAINTGTNVRLDGLVVRAGFARILNPDVADSEVGGGMYCVNGTPTLVNVRFEFNRAQGSVEVLREGCGAGLHSNFGNLTLRNCTFSRCHTTEHGGGLCKNNGGITLIGCRFLDCRADGYDGRGGGFATKHDNVQPVNAYACEFVGNFARQYAGGVLLGLPPASDLTGSDLECSTTTACANHAVFSSCLFAGNVTQSFPSYPLGGGAGARVSRATKFINCAFVANVSTFGTAVTSNHLGCAELYNCIAYHNVATQSGHSEFEQEFSACTTTSEPCVIRPYFSCIQGIGVETAYSALCGLQGNIDVDPMLRNVAAYNARLKETSPCLNAGRNLYVPLDSVDADDDGVTSTEYAPDEDLRERIRASTPGGIVRVDIGAYEFGCDGDLKQPYDNLVDGFDLAVLMGQWTGTSVYSPCYPARSGDLMVIAKSRDLTLPCCWAHGGRVRDSRRLREAEEARERRVVPAEATRLRLVCLRSATPAAEAMTSSSGGWKPMTGMPSSNGICVPPVPADRPNRLGQSLALQ